MTSTSERTSRLADARDLALDALREITPADTIGEPAGHRVEDDGVVSLLFRTKLLGYPGWFWTVSLSDGDGEGEPSVLEAGLLPGDDALLAPEWIPWSQRLEEYKAQQAAAAAEREGDDDEGDDDADEDDELHDDGSAFLHAGDVDGVDIDELDDDAEGDEDEDEDEEDGDEGDDLDGGSGDADE